MEIVKFPGKLPTPGQLDLPRARLTGLVHDLTRDLMQCQLDLMNADSGGEMAAAIHKTAGKLDEASRGWASMAKTVRESWGV